MEVTRATETGDRGRRMNTSRGDKMGRPARGVNSRLGSIDSTERKRIQAKLDREETFPPPP